jgi:CheY-like chemotaxis protein
VAPDARTILVVDGDAALRAELAQTLAAHRVLAAADGAAALELLARQPIDLILCDYRLRDLSGVDLLHRCEVQSPATKRLLLTTYSELPRIVHDIAHARATRLIASVIQKSTRPENIERIVAEALGQAAEASQPDGAADGFSWRKMEERMLWTAAEITQVRNVVIRQLAPDFRDLQLQFVLPAGADYENLRREVVREWLWPVKPRGFDAGPVAEHPVARMLGELADDHELYARKLDDDETYLYLALLPWRHEKRVTAALGVWSAIPQASLQLLVHEVHHFAVEEVAELPLPVLPAPSGTGAIEPGHTVLEYDWVVTESYVGPDRRSGPTSFFNRFVLVGRRRWVAGGVRRTTDPFIDRFLSYVRWYALAYLLFSTVDTILTYLFVRRGTVSELNPLLRPLVLHHPWAFLALKNVLSLAAFFTVARFQLFRWGKALLFAVVLAYALLDIYWIWVLR